MEDDLHSLAAGTMGVAFASACGARMWSARRSGVHRLSLVGLLVSVLVPLLMLEFQAMAGALQRLMFAFSFVCILDVLRAPSPSSTPPNGP